MRREEILDSRGRLAGYRFSCRSAGPLADNSAAAYRAALQAANVKAFAERRLAVIVISLDEWCDEDFVALAGPLTVFQLDGPGADLDPIKQSGAGVALPIGRGAMPAAELAQANMAVVDFSAAGFDAFERTVKTLKAEYPRVAIAVENLHSWTERRVCLALGVEYALGDFLDKPDAEEAGDKLNRSRLILIDMLNLLRTDADVETVGEVAKRDPGVAVQVLAMANSPVQGLAAPVVGIDQAIMVLGREALYRWLAVAVFRAGGGEHDEALLEVALARARFLELIGLIGLSKEEADELFLVGLLSFADLLLGRPMAELAQRLKLPLAVEDVLVRSDGRYANYLRLTLVMEKGDAERAALLAAALGIEAGTLDAYRGVALLWAEEALRGNRG